MVTLQLPVTLLIFRENHRLQPRSPVVPVTGCFARRSGSRTISMATFPRVWVNPWLWDTPTRLGDPKFGDIQEGEKVWEMMMVPVCLKWTFSWLFNFFCFLQGIDLRIFIDGQGWCGNWDFVGTRNQPFFWNQESWDLASDGLLGLLGIQGLRSKQPKPWAWLAVVAVAGERCGSHQLVSLKRGSTDKMVPSVGQSFDLTGKLLTSPGLNTWSRFLTWDQWQTSTLPS